MFIRLFAMIAAFTLAGFFLYLGVEHIAGEIGLTPWAAFPAALAVVMSPSAMYENAIEDLEDDIECVELQCDSLIDQLDDCNQIIDNHVCRNTKHICTCMDEPLDYIQSKFVPITDDIIDDAVQQLDFEDEYCRSPF